MQTRRRTEDSHKLVTTPDFFDMYTGLVVAALRPHRWNKTLIVGLKGIRARCRLNAGSHVADWLSDRINETDPLFAIEILIISIQIGWNLQLLPDIDKIRVFDGVNTRNQVDIRIVAFCYADKRMPNTTV